jgi:hypothetical protein
MVCFDKGNLLGFRAFGLAVWVGRRTAVSDAWFQIALQDSVTIAFVYKADILGQL